MKDGTAQGVAKVRHYESLHEPSKRLYHDPYAQHMYLGSFVQRWLGEGGTRWLYRVCGFEGILDMLSIRTRWIDDEIMKVANDGKEKQQLIILGAGYDTRGFRLNLQPAFECVWEVDQTEVQTKKIRNLRQIKDDVCIQERIDSCFVRYIGIDFNQESIDEKLQSSEGYSIHTPSVVTLEGVTQYLPKDSTAETLTALKKAVPAGSILLITYADQNVLDDPIQCGPPNEVKKTVNSASMVGEPWISFWTPDEFSSYVKELGYNVMSDSIPYDYIEKYLTPLGRNREKKEMLAMEHFVVATIE